MRIAMVGTGYVGLITGTCLAEWGHIVTCIDRDVDLISQLQLGNIPIHEPGLADLVRRNLSAGRLRFSSNLRKAVRASNVTFIAIGTPHGQGSGAPSSPAAVEGNGDPEFRTATNADDPGTDIDLGLADFMSTGEAIAHALPPRCTVVVKSTVPVGTCRKLAQTIARVRPLADFDMVSNPEFLREGSGVQDFQKPDRVVVGAESERARTVLRELYRPLTQNGTAVLFTSIEAAETAKHAANAMLAMRVAFMNEMADLCEQAGADVHEVATAIGMDRRIGPQFLQAGPGFGGSCLPKDLRLLETTTKHYQTPSRLVHAAIASNEERKASMGNRIIDACGGDVQARIVCVWGVSFKAGTDDMREAPSLQIIPALQRAGALVQAYDPAAMEKAPQLLSGVRWCQDPIAAASGAVAIVLLSDWPAFAELDYEALYDATLQPLILDLRHALDPTTVRKAGFEYRSLGLPGGLGPGERVAQTAKRQAS